MGAADQTRVPERVPATVAPLPDAPAAPPFMEGMGPAQVLALQRTSGNAATTRWLGRRAAAHHPKPVDHIPKGGTAVNKIGVVNEYTGPELRLRTSPHTSAHNVLDHLPFNTRLQVIKSFPGKWYFVSTQGGKLGYVASDYVATHLPEPNAFFHIVKGGVDGTAIAIAEQYFKKSAHWGEDLRFYVNAIAFVNGQKVPQTRSGWKDVKFDAGQRIWIPSQPFADSLKGRIQSGSLSYDALDKVGLAHVVERGAQLLQDFQRAIDNAHKYLGPSIRRHVEQSLRDAMESLAIAMIGAIAVMAMFTAAGAAVGGVVSGGAGAGLGAEAGFQLGKLFLEWLGLAFLIDWLIHAVGDTAGAFGRFLSSVWGAKGEQRKLDAAGRNFAEAIGVLLGNLVTALTLWLAAEGLKSGMEKVRSSRFGRMMGSALERWMKGPGKPAPSTIQEPLVQEILKGATPGKSSSSRQYEKHGGFAQAEKDFDALRPTNVRTVGDVKLGVMSDGSNVNVRRRSSGGKPTLEIQPVKGRGRPIKIRYP